ncbi:MAG: PKD domain-containing protein, partial [Chloroflexi bacterium]|nr:PKD domain-containing protein [Chloroflexota bacterium]
MRHISQVIAIAICVIGLTSIATAQDNTALPTDWTTETPIAWLNAQATPDLAPQAPAVNEPPAEGSDAYAIALDALVSVILGVVNTTGGAVVVGLGIWKFAPIVLAIAEFLTKLTPRTDDDAAVARLRTELERAGIIPITPTVTPTATSGKHDLYDQYPAGSEGKMLNDNNALVQAIAGFVALLTPTQKQAAIALAEIVTLALSDAPPPSPAAGFTHTLDGLNATFTDTSTGGHSRVWSFGDGLTSTAQHPTHVYTTAGTYCVTLTIANEEGEMSAATLLLTVLGGGIVGETTSITSGLQAWWKFRQLTGAAAVVNDGTTGSADDLTPDDTGVTAQNSGPNGRLATAASSGTTFWEGDTTSSLLQSTDYTVALLFYKD